MKCTHQCWCSGFKIFASPSQREPPPLLCIRRTLGFAWDLFVVNCMQCSRDISILNHTNATRMLDSVPLSLIPASAETFGGDPPPERQGVPTPSLPQRASSVVGRHPQPLRPSSSPSREAPFSFRSSRRRRGKAWLSIERPDSCPHAGGATRGKRPIRRRCCVERLG